MKNLIALFCVASAVTASAADAEPNAEVYTESGNTFGVLRVDIGTVEQAIIAVPWLEPSTGDAQIAVTNVIKTANLRANDQLYYYDTTERKYQVWQLNASKAWEAFQSVGDNDNVMVAGNASLQRGNAILLKRPGEKESSVYLYGQVATSSSVETTMAMGSADRAAYTLIAPPTVTRTNANAGNWANVKKGDYIVLPDHQVLNWKMVGEKITWGRYVQNDETREETFETGDAYASIPAGQGAWFVSAKGATATAVTVTWAGVAVSSAE